VVRTLSVQGVGRVVLGSRFGGRFGPRRGGLFGLFLPLPLPIMLVELLGFGGGVDGERQVRRSEVRPAMPPFSGFWWLWTVENNWSGCVNTYSVEVDPIISQELL
jgi:hypothetical protein